VYATPASAQFLRDRPVLRREPGARIHHEQDCVGLVHRLARLPRHLVVDARLCHRLETACVHHEIRLAAKAPAPVLAVARQARHVGDDRVAAARNAVEQRGFPHVGPANYGNDWEHQVTRQKSEGKRQKEK